MFVKVIDWIKQKLTRMRSDEVNVEDNGEEGDLDERLGYSVEITQNDFDVVDFYDFYAY